MQSTPTASAFWLSKTFWVNLVALLSLLIPAVAEWIKTNPIDFAAVLAAVNVVLKFITHGQSSMVGDDPDPDRQELSDEKADRLYREFFADAPAKKSDSESESPSTLPAPGSTPSPGAGTGVGKYLALTALIGAMTLPSCGHSVTYDGSRLIVRKDGVTVTIDREQDAPSVPVKILPTKK